jgi:hypothetical protein
MLPNIDLNRNFPLPNGELHPDSNPWAPETIALMNFFNEHNFVLGGEFHGGECIVYCPWSYTHSSTGEMSFCIRLLQVIQYIILI